MSRIPDSSGIRISPEDRAKLIELGAKLKPIPSTMIQHYLSLTLNNGELEYSVNCVAQGNSEDCDLPGEYEACGWNEWIEAAGIENTHHDVIRLGVWPVAFEMNGDDCEMTTI